MYKLSSRLVLSVPPPPCYLAISSSSLLIKSFTSEFHFCKKQTLLGRTCGVKTSATTILNQFNSNDFNVPLPETNIGSQKTASSLSRYESQKWRDWNTFGQYPRNHKPPLVLSRCSGAHILEFLRYLDQFGKTKVHNTTCLFFGHPHPPAPSPCPLKQAWGSLDALVGRLRAAFEENGGTPESNPFAARAVRLYPREVRDSQAKARGITYDKKKSNDVNRVKFVSWVGCSIGYTIK